MPSTEVGHRKGNRYKRFLQIELGSRCLRDQVEPGITGSAAGDSHHCQSYGLSESGHFSCHRRIRSTIAHTYPTSEVPNAGHGRRKQRAQNRGLSATLSLPSCGSFFPFDHERGEFSPTAWRRLQFFENLVGSRASEWPLVPLLHLMVRRHSTTDDGLLIRRQVHDRNLTVLPAAAADRKRLKLLQRNRGSLLAESSRHEFPERIGTADFARAVRVDVPPI